METAEYETSRTWQVIAHLAALMPIPLGIIIGPGLVWMVKRKSPPVVAQAKRALNFQISVYLYLCGGWPLVNGALVGLLALVWVLVPHAGTWLDPTTARGGEIVRLFAITSLCAMVACVVAWLTIVIIAAVWTSLRRPFRYPLSITFIKS